MGFSEAGFSTARSRPPLTREATRRRVATLLLAAWLGASGCAAPSPPQGPGERADHERWSTGIERARSALDSGDLAGARNGLVLALREGLHFSEADPRLAQTTAVIARYAAAQRDPEPALDFLEGMLAEDSARVGGPLRFFLLGELASGYALSGRAEAARRAVAELEEASSRRYGADHPLPISVRVQRAALELQLRGDPKLVARMAEEAADTAAAALGPDSGLYGRALAIQGRALAADRRSAEAIEVLKRADAVIAAREGQEPSGPGARLEALLPLAGAYQDQERIQEETRTLEMAADLLTATSGETNPLLVGVLSRLAFLHVSGAAPARGLEEAERALRIAEAIDAPLEPRLAALSIRVRVGRMCGQREALAGAIQKSRDLLAESVIPDASTALMIRVTIAALVLDVEGPQAAIALLEPHLSEAGPLLGDSPDVRGLLNDVAYVLAQGGRVGDAAPLAERAFQLAEHGGNPTNRHAVYDTLGVVRSLQGRHAEGIELIQGALSHLEQVFGPESSAAVEVIENLAAARMRAGERETADQLRTRAEAIRARVAAEVQRASGEQEAIESEEDNYRIALPLGAWVQIEPSTLGWKAELAFLRDPELFAILLAGAPGTAMSASSVADAFLAGMREKGTLAAEARKPLELAGVQGIQLEGTFQTGAEPQRWLTWIGERNGFMYQFIFFGSIGRTSETFRAQAGELLSRFSQLQPERAVTASEGPVGAASELFGYRVDLAESGWRAWEDTSETIPGADFGAQSSEGIFFVIPLALLGSEPSDAAGFEAIAELVSIRVPRETTSLRLGNAHGIEFRGGRMTSDGKELEQRVRILRTRTTLFLVVASVMKGSDRSESLLAAVERFEPIEAPAAPAAPAEVPEARRHAHAAVLGRIAGYYAGAHQFERALEFLALARAMAPDVADLAEHEGRLLLRMGRFREAATSLGATAGRFPDRPILRGLLALAHAGLGDRRAALATYHAAFTEGLQDDDLLVDYADELRQAGRTEDALEVLDAQIARGGSAGLRKMADRAFKRRFYVREPPLCQVSRGWECPR